MGKYLTISKGLKAAEVKLFLGVDDYEYRKIRDLLEFDSSKVFFSTIELLVFSIVKIVLIKRKSDVEMFEGIKWEFFLECVKQNGMDYYFGEVLYLDVEEKNVFLSNPTSQFEDQFEPSYLINFSDIFKNLYEYFFDLDDSEHYSQIMISDFLETKQYFLRKWIKTVYPNIQKASYSRNDIFVLRVFKKIMAKGHSPSDLENMDWSVLVDTLENNSFLGLFNLILSVDLNPAKKCITTIKSINDFDPSNEYSQPVYLKKLVIDHFNTFINLGCQGHETKTLAFSESNFLQLMKLTA